MKLSAPTLVVFLVSLAVAVLVLAVKYAGIAVPVVSAHSFEVLLVAYALLLIGALFPGN